MDPQLVQLQSRAASVKIVEHVGIKIFRILHMESIKQNLTSQQKRSRAAVNYSSCVCKSGDEAAQGSLPAQRPHSDQVISGVVFSSRAAGTRAPGPGLFLIGKLQATSVRRQATSVRRQATSDKRQAKGASSNKRLMWAQSSSAKHGVSRWSDIRPRIEEL